MRIKPLFFRRNPFRFYGNNLKLKMYSLEGIKFTKIQPKPLKINVNAWVFRLEQRSMMIHDIKNAGTSTKFTSIKFTCLLPLNSTEDNESP